MYIDSHAHLTSDQLFPIVDDILERARAHEIGGVVNICTDSASLGRALKLREAYPWVYNTAATTPHDVDKEGESFFPEVEMAAQAGQLVAIGETGLDYFYEHSEKTIQQKYLSKYFALASSHDLPIIFHCRDAFDDLFSIADKEYHGRAAVLHCFTGSLAEARRALDRGWYISFSGIVTFKKSIDLQEVARYVPLDRMFIETDSPYLAPQSKRGKVNEPSFLPEIAAFISTLKNIHPAQVAEATSSNIRAFFSF